MRDDERSVRGSILDVTRDVPTGHAAERYRRAGCFMRMEAVRQRISLELTQPIGEFTAAQNRRVFDDCQVQGRLGLHREAEVYRVVDKPLIADNCRIEPRVLLATWTSRYAMSASSGLRSRCSRCWYSAAKRSHAAASYCSSTYAVTGSCRCQGNRSQQSTFFRRKDLWRRADLRTRGGRRIVSHSSIDRLQAFVSDVRF